VLAQPRKGTPRRGNVRIVETTILIAVVVAVCLLVGLALLRRTREAPSPSATSWTQSSNSNDGVALASAGASLLSPLEFPRINPIASLSFQDALEPTALAQACQMSVEKAIRTSLTRHAGDAIAATFQGIALRGSGVVVTFSRQGYKLMPSGDGFKAVAIGQGNKIVELGNVDAIAQWTNRLANTTALVVALAHVISGADLSRRLAKVQAGIDQLLAYRGIDQLAALRTAYESLRDEFAKDKPNVDRILRCRDEIREVRHRLVAESVEDLQRILPLPRRHRLEPASVHAWRVRPESKVSRSRQHALRGALKKAILASHCLRLEQVVAFLSDEFETIELPSAEAVTDFRRLATIFKGLEDGVHHAEPQDILCSTTVTALADAIATTSAGMSRSRAVAVEPIAARNDD
jgi:hypothetical protein